MKFGRNWIYSFQNNVIFVFDVLPLTAIFAVIFTAHAKNQRLVNYRTFSVETHQTLYIKFVSPGCCIAYLIIIIYFDTEDRDLFVVYRVDNRSLLITM